MRTARLKLFMEKVLSSLPKPHTEDVIEDVFAAIESNQGWRHEYDELVAEFGKTVTNAWGGFWIADAEGRHGVEQIPARRTTLLASYSKLTRAGKPIRGGKRKEAEALELMAAYYQAHKASLSPLVRERRDLIVDLIMEGFEPAEAFAKAVDGPGKAG